MQETITLFEHEPYIGAALAWGQREDADLDRLQARRLGEAVRLIRYRGHLTVQATQYVGVLRIGRHTIQVLPKMYRASAADKERQPAEATRNLLHLLKYALDIPVH